jgi:5-methylcytosine-specific restriction endonuclease McrA
VPRRAATLRATQMPLHIVTIYKMAARLKRRSRDEYERAVAETVSAAGALRLLGLRPAGGNYAVLRARIREHGISTAHWLGQGHLKGKSNAHAPSVPLEQVLVRQSRYRGSTSLLKSRLVRSGALAYNCTRCGMFEWMGRALALHLDHVNGDRTDNRLENLRLLCPNCHSQTPTYCGRNKGRASLDSTSLRSG